MGKCFHCGTSQDKDNGKCTFCGGRLEDEGDRQAQAAVPQTLGGLLDIVETGLARTHRCTDCGEYFVEVPSKVHYHLKRDYSFSVGRGAMKSRHSFAWDSPVYLVTYRCPNQRWFLFGSRCSKEVQYWRYPNGILTRIWAYVIDDGWYFRMWWHANIVHIWGHRFFTH